MGREREWLLLCLLPSLPIAQAFIPPMVAGVIHRVVSRGRGPIIFDAGVEPVSTSGNAAAEQAGIVKYKCVKCGRKTPIALSTQNGTSTSTTYRCQRCDDNANNNKEALGNRFSSMVKGRGDVIELSKKADVNRCRRCLRIEARPGHGKALGQWTQAPLGSRTLMNHCLKLIKNIDRVKVIDVAFVATDENSRRIRIQLRIAGALRPRHHHHHHSSSRQRRADATAGISQNLLRKSENGANDVDQLPTRALMGRRSSRRTGGGDGSDDGDFAGIGSSSSSGSWRRGVKFITTPIREIDARRTGSIQYLTREEEKKKKKKALSSEISLKMETPGVGRIPATRQFVFKIDNKQCDDCVRDARDDVGDYTVQIRYRFGGSGSGSSSLDKGREKDIADSVAMMQQQLHDARLSLEQSLSKRTRFGIDMIWRTKKDAEKAVRFLEKLLPPMRVHTTRKLVTHDEHTSYHRYKIAYGCDVMGVWPHDLIILPEKEMARLSGAVAQPLLICKKVSAAGITLFDPTLSSVPTRSNPRANTIELGGRHLWGDMPKVVASGRRDLTRFIVLDADVDGRQSSRSEVLITDYDGGMQEHIACKSHLARSLHPGDVVWGFRVYDHALPVERKRLERIRAVLPEVVLFRKDEEEACRQTKTTSAASCSADSAAADC